MVELGAAAVRAGLNGGPGSPADADDVLVFQADDATFRLIGGRGRGAGWADIVEFRMDDEPIVRRAWQSGALLRLEVDEAVRVVGPYWACNAVVVPVGQDHLVVFGSRRRINDAEGLLVQAAARIVAESQTVPADKLLADELEVVHAVRALTAYRPETIRDTARHIALVAARALSCDVAAVHVQQGDRGALEVMRFIDGAVVDPDGQHAGPDADAYLAGAAKLPGPLVEQEVGPNPRIWAENVVSRLTLPIGGADRIGALALGHASNRPRGFTSLCQRIGRALAESAELLLDQASTRERLAVEHELLRRASSTDPLTGVGNRARWEEVTASFAAIEQVDHARIGVLSVDLDQLKTVNDRYGHSAGDAVIRGAANLLRACIRDTDVLARVGGDEFLVLLRDSDEADVRRVVRRISRRLRTWRATEHDLTPALSVGWAVCSEGNLKQAVAAADRRMYSAKRRRARSGPRTERIDRRVSRSAKPVSVAGRPSASG